MIGPHNAHDLIGGRYEIIEFIGEGGMQYVYSAIDKVLDRIVAVKTPKNDSAVKRFKRSAVVAAKVNHPNVAKTLDYLKIAEREYLVEELIEGEDLDKALLQKVKCLDPYLAAKVFHYLSKAVAAAHHVGVIHRDLKPTNIMVAGDFGLDAIKITDFGIAKLADEELAEAAEGGGLSLTASKTAVGALPYMAPEAIETPRTVGRPADIWSLGAMMYHLLTGQLPFGSGLRAVKQILDGKIPAFPGFLTTSPQFSPLTVELMSLVTDCLNYDPVKRLSADQLVQRCGQLYYPVAKREQGSVRKIYYGGYGFIDCGIEDVFFNMASVYGGKPSEDDLVMFSRYGDGDTKRAHPVVLLPRE